ncbi:MAG: carboxymuconolactone decarboxylase family protein [Alphaproteobacteria bacterium]
MTEFTIHDIESAPEASRPMLEKAKQTYGMIPNLLGVLAESPAALEAYMTLGQIYGSKTSLTTEEQNVVWLAIIYENDCHYCMPAHTAIAKQAGVADDIVEAMRNGTPLPDAKLQALRTFTAKLVARRGFVDEQDMRALLDAGYTRQTILDIVVGVSHKTLSNYINHLARTPVDPPFTPFEWRKPDNSQVE